MVVDGHSNRGPLIRIYQLFVTTSSILPTIKTQNHDKTIRNEANINNKIPHLNGIIKIIQRELTELYLQNKLQNNIQSEQLNQNNCYRTIKIE